MPTECRCSGVSGHCTARACWQTTPPSLKVSSKRLKELYNKAVKLNSHDISRSTTAASPAQSPVPRNRHSRNLVNDTKLVYITDSPNYCKPNRELGIPGTLNRECDYTKDNSCTKLCSSCGYRKHSVVRKVVNNKCNCKFHWCCKVTCDTCVERKLITTCLQTS